MTFKKDWESLKKDLTWNNFKICISAGIPFAFGLYIYALWMQVLNPLLEKYSGQTTAEGVLLDICLVIALVAPIWPLLMWSTNIGLWVGKVTRFYKYDYPKKIYFGGAYYNIKDMPQEERNKIKEILSPYRRFNSKREAKKYKEEHAKTKVDDE